MKVAINGAGIAGTALAFWLGRIGHEVLLVERAPKLRTGRYILATPSCNAGGYRERRNATRSAFSCGVRFMPKRVS